MLLEIALAYLLSGADVVSTSLAELTRCSDWIVVGRVMSVHELPIVAAASDDEERFGPTIHLGEAKVERWVKGAPVAGNLLFSAWLCDATDGFGVGDRALLFLRRQDVGERIDRRIDDYAARFGSRPLLRVLRSGLGEMPILDGAPDAKVEISKDVKLPAGAAIGPGSEEHLRTVALSWMLETIDQIIPVQRVPQVRLRALKGSTPGLAWDLTLLLDRTATLTVHRPDGPTEHTFVFNAVHDVDVPLRDSRGFRGMTEIGLAGGPWDRELTTWVDGREHHVSIGRLDAPEPTWRMQEAAQLWTALRDAIDFPECIDHREADRKALERR